MSSLRLSLNDWPYLAPPVSRKASKIDPPIGSVPPAATRTASQSIREYLYSLNQTASFEVTDRSRLVPLPSYGSPRPDMTIDRIHRAATTMVEQPDRKY